MPREGEYPHNVTPLNSEGFLSRRAQKDRMEGTFEEDPNTFSDTEFAHHRLAKWAHPVVLQRITSVINSELTSSQTMSLDRHSAAPSLLRLRDLMTNPQYENMHIPGDPYVEHFAGAHTRAHSDDQHRAIDAVQRLHQVSIASELSEQNLDPHIRDIVVAIINSEA